MRIRDKKMELALGLGALVPGSAIATATPTLAGAAVIASGAAFTSAFLFGEGARDRHHRTVLSALLLPGIVGATTLVQLDVAVSIQNTYAGLVLILVAVALALSQGYLSLPTFFSDRVTRLLSLPWIVLLASSFSSVLSFAADKAVGGEDLGFTLFIFLGVMPMLFGFFIVGAAKLVDEASVSRGAWVARYVLTVSSALLSAFVLGALLQR
jgi:hypothetical protein